MDFNGPNLLSELSVRDLSGLAYLSLHVAQANRRVAVRKAATVQDGFLFAPFTIMIRGKFVLMKS